MVLVSRRIRKGAGRWIRKALLLDLEEVDSMHRRFAGTPYPLVVALRAGRAVTVRWWELPDRVKDEIAPVGGPRELWRLTADNQLELVQ